MASTDPGSSPQQAEANQGAAPSAPSENPSQAPAEATPPTGPPSASPQPTDSPSQQPSAPAPSESHDHDHAPPSRDLYLHLLDQVSTKPCHVVRLDKEYEREGRELRTKAYIIDRELERVHQAETLEQLQDALNEAGERLQQLDVFSRIDMLVTEEPEDDPEGCTVKFDLDERNWYKVSAATYFQGGENTAELGVGLHNLTGHAEHITASVEYGTQLSNQFALTYQQPRLRGWPVSAEARLMQHLTSHTQISSYKEQLRNISLSLKSLTGVHTLQYELGWRSVLVDVTATGASRAVQAQAGDFLKAAARYTFLLDRRNRNTPLGNGWAVRSSTEVSGLGPDQTLRYVKQQLDGQVSLPVTQSVVLNLSASTGIMLPWGGSQPLNRPTCIADRFFLGGPSTLRGFKYQRVGPTDARRGQYAPVRAEDATASGTAGSARRDFLGGDLYSSVLAEVLFPLPHKALSQVNIFGHVFVNGGNCDLLAGTGKPFKDGVRSWLSSWRWSAGVGLVLPTWFGRFEANYVHVLSQQEHDRVKRGIQLGFASSLFT